MIWLIAVIVFVVLAVTSILEYNARIAEAAEYLREKYGISDTPDVYPFLATSPGRLLVFYGFALFISGLFVWQ